MKNSDFLKGLPAVLIALRKQYYPNQAEAARLLGLKGRTTLAMRERRNYAGVSLEDLITTCEILENAIEQNEEN